MSLKFAFPFPDFDPFGLVVVDRRLEDTRDGIGLLHESRRWPLFLHLLQIIGFTSSPTDGIRLFFRGRPACLFFISGGSKLIRSSGFSHSDSCGSGLMDSSYVV